jgi:predicted porin
MTRFAMSVMGRYTAASQWELSYTYPFSKRRQVYAGYVKLDNDRRAAYVFSNNAYTVNTSCQVTRAFKVQMASRQVSCSA